MSRKSPILLLIFNRPDLTQKVLNQIRQYRPSRFYIAADGPRESITGEKTLCQQTRDLVLSEINWECEVKTLFREKNLGCGVCVPESISWFFSHEEMGVILEDDILVHEDFFKFADQMLDRYKHEKRIMMVSGFNYRGSSIISNKYFFTINPYVWGWATWRRAWELFDFSLEQWPEINKKQTLKNTFPSVLERYRKTKQISKVYGVNKPDTWDPHWALALIVNDGRVILPEANLCRHIGIDGGTHYQEQSNHMATSSGNIAFGKVTFPLTHPDDFARNIAFEKSYVRNRLKGRIKHILGLP